MRSWHFVPGPADQVAGLQGEVRLISKVQAPEEANSHT